MTTAKLWAALATVTLTTISACSGVDKCIEGVDTGCLNSAPDDSGNCKFGLVASSDGLTCVKAGSASAGDAGSGRADGGSCSCPSGQLCREDGTCVNLCTPVANPPVAKATLLPCVAPAGVTESFGRIALALCYQTCMHRAVYCGTSCDPDTDCTQTVASTTARTACLGNEDQACATKLCEAARDLPCAQQQCPTGTLNCAGALCSNSCSTPDYNNDGVCDDGDPSNAISYACDYGTDCGDCGPRNGKAAPTTLDLGDVCADPSQCGGDLNSVKTSTGWCVPATSSQTYARCVPDCSNGKTCAAGYDCSGIASDDDGDGGMQPVQFTDYNDGTPVFGCFPSQCN